MNAPRAVYSPLKKAVLLSVGRDLIWLDAHRCPPLVAFLRAWPLGACGIARLTNPTGRVLVRDWQADDVANALVLALDVPVLAAKLLEENAQ